MKIAYSCVVDDSPKLLWEVLVWVAALRGICGIPPESLFLHVTDRVNDEARTLLQSLNCSVVNIQPFHPTYRFANKLRQIDARAFSSFEYVALLDADIEVLEPYGLEDVDRATVAGVTDEYGSEDVDKPPAARVPEFVTFAVSLEVWKRLLGAFGVSGFESVPCTLGGFTYRNYLNGGLYLTPVALLDRLGPQWRSIASSILEGRQDLFGANRAFIDQISFALAMQQIGLAAKILPRHKNLPPSLVPFTPRISAIHGQHKFDALLYYPDGTHRWSGQADQPERYAALDEIIRRTNASTIGAPFHHYRAMKIHRRRGESEQALAAAAKASECRLGQAYLREIAEVMASHGRKAEALALLDKTIDRAGTAQSPGLLALRDRLL
jgi:hypothetical protein